MKVSTTGYKRNSKDKKHKQLFIPGDQSGNTNLTMLGVDHYVQATPVYPNGNFGGSIMMRPGVPTYNFPGAMGVIEQKLPKAQIGLPYGGAESLRWNTDFKFDAFAGNNIYETIELNRRAKAMGWNSVDEYRNANWEANPKALQKNIEFQKRVVEANRATNASLRKQAELQKNIPIYTREQGVLNDDENPNNVINRSQLDKDIQASADWEKSWYSKRAQLPQFKDVATQRLNHVNDIKSIPWRDEQFKKEHPNAGAFYDPNYNNINFPEKQFNSYKNPRMVGSYRPVNMTMTHERSHWYDHNYPQSMPNEGTNYNYIDNGQILGSIIPKEYAIPSSSTGTNDYWNLDEIKKPFKTSTNNGSDYGSDYYYNPTEIRARLNEWRRFHNIDPLKNYTNDEIQKIIDRDIRIDGKYWNGNYNMDLYKVVRGRGDLLKQLNDRFVSNDDKDTSDQLPQAQLGLIDKLYKRRVLNQYPAMQNVYGPKGENLNIIRDRNFDASSHGFGDIEFIFPGSGTVNYSDDYTYQSPTPDKYTAVYNPKGAKRGDVFLDMLHGMRDDPSYQQVLQNFTSAVRTARDKDMDYFYDRDVASGWAVDGRESWDKSYIDGMLRSLLSQYAPGRVSGESDYKIERTGASPEMQDAARDIYDYLRLRPKKLSEQQQGGSLPKAQTLGPVKPRIGIGVGYEQTPTEFGLHLNPKNIELPPMAAIAGAVPYAFQTSVVGAPNQWMPLPDWSESSTYKAELDNTNNSQNFEGYVQNSGDGKMSTSFPVNMPAWMLPNLNIVEPLPRAGKYAREFMTAHPNPDDWEDGRDPNSPVTELLLGNMLGIGKTATNPYTGKGWSYYNRRTNWQNAKNDYIAEKLLAANPQGNRSRQEWLASFSPGELDVLAKSKKYSGEIAANRWKEGFQGLSNFLSRVNDPINIQGLKGGYQGRPELFKDELSSAEAQDAGGLEALGMLAIPAQGVKGWITEGSNRGWKGASPIDYTGGRDVVTNLAGEIVMDPLNLVGSGVLKNLGKLHAGILDDIISKSVQEAGKFNYNPTAVFIRNAQRKGLIPASANVQTLLDNPNLLNTVITRGIKNNLTVGRRVTPSAGAGVAESSSGTITPLATGDAAALSRFTGDPIGEAFHMGTHIPGQAYGMRSGLQSLPRDVDALYFDAPGNFAQQSSRVLPNPYGDFTVTSRIPFDYSIGPNRMYSEYMKMLESAKPMRGGVGAKPGDIFGKLHGIGANESAIIGRPGQQVLEPVSVSTITNYNKPLEEFDELFKLSKEDPEKFKQVFWEKYNSGQIARTKQEAGLADNQTFIEPLYGDLKNNPTINDLRFALRADANNKQLALKAAAPVQKTNFSPLTTNFGNSAPVQLTGSQANRRLATAKKQFDVLNKRGYENLTPDELLDAFRLEHEIKTLSKQVDNGAGSAADAVNDFGGVDDLNNTGNVVNTTGTKETIDLRTLPRQFNTKFNNPDNLDFRSIRLNNTGETLFAPFIKNTDTPFHFAYKKNLVDYFNSPGFNTIMDTYYPNVDKELYKAAMFKNLEKPLAFNPNLLTEGSSGVHYSRNPGYIGKPSFEARVRNANSTNPNIVSSSGTPGRSYVARESSVKHEYRHQATNQDELLPDFMTEDNLKENMSEAGKARTKTEIESGEKYRGDNYYSRPTEFDVRVRRLKDDLKENGIADYFEGPITEEHINQLLAKQAQNEANSKDMAQRLWQEFQTDKKAVRENANLSNAEKKAEIQRLTDQYIEHDTQLSSKKPKNAVHKNTAELLRYWDPDFIAQIANFLPAAIPVGIGIGAATQEKKKGGKVAKYNSKALDDYFTNAWASSRKSS